MTTIVTHKNYDDIITGFQFPQIVYKYRTWTDNNHKAMLSKQIVFMARPISFEDPLDCKLFKRYDLLTEEQIYEKYLLSSKQENPNRTRQQHRKFARDWTKKSPMRNKANIRALQESDFKEFDKRFGVLSLTANPTNYIMWDKYSERHKGLCIGFSSEKLFRHISGGGKVDYPIKLPDIMPFDDYIVEHHKQVFSKEKKWEFEDEYRTFKFYQSEATEEERSIKIPKNCFKQIIFGANMTQEDKQEIISLCSLQELTVDFFSATINNGSTSIASYGI